MIRYLLFFMLSCWGKPTLSQHLCSVKHAYSFYTVNMPGMIPIDDKGNPLPVAPSVERTIYLECSGIRMPVIDSILFDNVLMKTNVSRVSGTTIIFGKRVENGQDFGITCRKGYTLWKVAVYPANPDHTVNQDCRNIVIKTWNAGRSCRLNLNREIQLMGLPRY